MVSGDPDKPGGLYVLRIRNLDWTKIPPHWHPEGENITVLKGTFLVGMGDHFDERRLKAMKAGDFIAVNLDHRGGMSIVAIYPYRIENKKVIRGKSWAGKGEGKIFAAEPSTY